MSRRDGWFGRHRTLTTLLAVLLVFWTVGVAVGDEDPAERRPRAGAGAEGGAAGTTGATDQQEPSAGDPGRGRSEGPAKKPKPEPKPKPKPSESAKPTPAPTPPKKQSTYLVSRIVDGDTLELGNGQTVRLVGIDTPEVGECGFEAASDALAGLVLGQQVRLTVSDEDRDQYGRLLRYVNVGTMDAGLRLIKRGLAIARYDSRDGYGHHPREGFYVEADAVSKGFNCPKPKPVPLVGGGSCAPGYTPCVPPSPPDLDCGDLAGPIQVSGSDPHGLDADGDGVACEP